VAAGSYRRWERNERALRTGAPLPPSGAPRLLAAALVVTSLLSIV
jgi:uncharacterized membrane protein YidH (DUF202 family)